MIVIALHQDGVAEVVSPSRLFQGSDSEKVFVLSPYPASCPVQITAVTKKCENVTRNGSHVPMRLVNNSPYNVMTRVELPADFAAVSVSLWEYDPPVAWTAGWGTLCISGLVQIPKYGQDERREGAPYAYKNLTTFSCEVRVEETVVPALPTVDDVDAYAELLAIVTEYESILGSIDEAPTEDSGNLVLSGGTYQAIETAKEEAVDTAKGYTDEKIAEITGDANIVNGVKGNAEAEYRHGNVNITPANIGLGNVDNTSDLDKPVSTAQQTALDGKVSKKPDGTNDLINSNNKVNNVYLPDFLLGQVLYGGTFAATTATATLSTNARSRLGTSNNTIVLTNDTSAVTGYEANEGIYYIATDSGTFAGLAIVTGDWLISNGSAWAKIDNTDAVQSVAGKTGAVVLDKSDVGLGNVDNTSDMDKPVSTAQQTALDGKQNTLTFDSTPTAGSNNPVTSEGILAAILAGGTGVTFDDTPTAGSDNPVKSKGIKSYVDDNSLHVYTSLSDISSSLSDSSTIDSIINNMAVKSALYMRGDFSGSNVPAYLPTSLYIDQTHLWNSYVLSIVKMDAYATFPACKYNVTLVATKRMTTGSEITSMPPRRFYYENQQWIEIASWGTIKTKLSTTLEDTYGYLPDETTCSFYINNASQLTDFGLSSSLGTGQLTITRLTNNAGIATYVENGANGGYYVATRYYQTNAYVWGDWYQVNKARSKKYIHYITLSGPTGDPTEMRFSIINSDQSAYTTMDLLLAVMNGSPDMPATGVYFSGSDKKTIYGVKGLTYNTNYTIRGYVFDTSGKSYFDIVYASNYTISDEVREAS